MILSWFRYLPFVIILFFANKIYAQSLTFSMAKDIMYKDNSLIKVAEKKEEVHKYELKTSQGLRYPKIGAFGMGIYLNKELGADLNGIRNGIGGLLHLPDPSLLGNWDVTLLKRGIAFGGVDFLWPLFSGGKINAAVEASRIKSEIGEMETISTKNKLISELAQRYFQVKLADEAVIVRKKVLEGMNRHLYNATKLEEQGIIAPVEKLQADVAVSEANRQYLAAKKDAALARVALSNTLETEIQSADLSTDFFVSPFIKPLEYYQSAAILNYPELQKLQLQIDLAEQGIKAKKSSYYPTVATFGQAILVHNNPVGLVEKDQKPWLLGVGISYTLFEGLQHKNEIKSAKATKESVELYQQRANIDIKTIIEKIYYDLEKQDEQIKNLEVQIKLAEELVRVRNFAFSEGVASSIDVVDAESNLSGVRLQKLQAEYNYVTDLASLLEYSGLSEEFLTYTK